MPYNPENLPTGGKRGQGLRHLDVRDERAPAPALVDERNEEQEVIG